MLDKTTFCIGQLVEHKHFGYRGVIYQVDSKFNLTDEWYQSMASSSPPKNAPWYRVMVHNANYTTYVSQQNLLEDSSAKQINHPELGKHFGYFIDGQYIKKKTFN